ncbi:BTAD domain-containing putative transcriptional regulator [Streptomyces sp. NPDC017936]|uniref:AfsR/SARP family transcriptional regulator n=1 Tax=Streptomyces sp. NPDC017936 TaxID=3365016 RepID=UPI0037999BA2
MTAGIPPACTSGPARLGLLGGFSLRAGARPLPTPPAGQRLLAYLAVQHDPVSRAKAAHTLWPDTDDTRAAACLRSALWRLPLTVPCLVEHPAGALALTAGVQVDTHELERQAAALASPDPIDPPELPAPRALCHDLLPDWSDDWLLAHREWLRQLRLRTLERLCVRHREAGALDAALEAAMAAVACEPLRESAHRLVVTVHLADGNVSEALRQYELYRLLLRDELGLTPTPTFRRLLAHVLGRPVDTGDTSR